MSHPPVISRWFEGLTFKIQSATFIQMLLSSTFHLHLSDWRRQCEADLFENFIMTQACSYFSVTSCLYYNKTVGMVSTILHLAVWHWCKYCMRAGWRIFNFYLLYLNVFRSQRITASAHSICVPFHDVLSLTGVEASLLLDPKSTLEKYSSLGLFLYAKRKSRILAPCMSTRILLTAHIWP